MRHSPLLLVSVILLALSGVAFAEGIDGSKPISCALNGASQCDDAICTGIEVALIELPPAWDIDFAAREIASADDTRTSPISGVELLEKVLVLQGHQNGRGWT